MNNPVIRVDGIRKQFGSQEILKESFLRSAGRTDLRVSRPQRGRQDDADPHAAGIARSERRLDQHPRDQPANESAGRAAASRLSR